MTPGSDIVYSRYYGYGQIYMYFEYYGYNLTEIFLKVEWNIHNPNF